MMSFFHKASKNNAKARLINCISLDREKIFVLPTESIRLEMENIIKKYFEFEGKLKIKIDKTENNGMYTISLVDLKTKDIKGRRNEKCI
ncbi:MAG: hypothetical protein ACI3XA_08425 [Clostridia bacterium]